MAFGFLYPNNLQIKIYKRLGIQSCILGQVGFRSQKNHFFNQFLDTPARTISFPSGFSNPALV
ncbi:hypothetical protein B0E43_06365 [Algoriphagus sp. A40]|nr:hypothetical protein B0E43_06365 [Algoriphagus sp. A40]